MSAGAQYGSKGPSRERSGVGGTIDELGPGSGERWVNTGSSPRSFLPRVTNRQATAPAEVHFASGRQRYPGSKCCRREDYPRIPAPLAWVSPNQEEKTSPLVAEASPAKSSGGILAHPMISRCRKVRPGYTSIHRERVHRPRRPH